MKQWPANLLCKCFKGHKNVLRGEFDLISLFWLLRKSLRGAGAVISLGENQKRCVDLFCGFESHTLAHLHPRQSVSTQQPLNTMPG